MFKQTTDINKHRFEFIFNADEVHFLIHCALFEAAPQELDEEKNFYGIAWPSFPMPALTRAASQ